MTVHFYCWNCEESLGVGPQPPQPPVRMFTVEERGRLHQGFACPDCPIPDDAEES